MLSSSLRSSVACLSIMLKKMEKRVGAWTQPCFTPMLIAKGSERSPLSLTWPLPNRCRPLRGWKTRPKKERRGRPNRHQSTPAPRERGLIQPFFRYAGPWTPSCSWRGFWPYRGMSKRIPDRQPRLGLATCVRQK